MKEHAFYKIKWIGFPKTHRKVKGVYKIGFDINIYIGASIHIRSRIIQHISSVDRLIKICKFSIDDFETLKEKYIAFYLLEKLPIPICYLSGDPNQEEYYHHKYGIDVHKNTKFYHQNKKFQELLKNVKT